MKIFNLFILLAVLFVSDYAFAQTPSCLCDDVELSTGLTGNDFVDILCPGGELGEGTEFTLTADRVEIFSESLLYDVLGPGQDTACGIIEIGVDGFGTQISDQEAADCRASLIQRCDLNQINPIPTLSQWGMIATAGVLGVIGLYVAMRRRKAAA